MNSQIKDRTGITLIVLSSILLGIWATVHTIALRNIMLVICAIISIIYLKEFLKVNHRFFFKTRLSRSDLLDWMPSALIVVMFIWVIAHYIFFAQLPEKQWDELTSTWYRAFLAAIIGFGCALALQRNPSHAWMLWFGLVVSFLVLIYQYIPKSIANQSLFAPDHYGRYIYWAKFSGVLAGTILFAGSLGFFIDLMRWFRIYSGIDRNKINRLHKFTYIFMIILGLFLPLYAHVFIFSAKNGVGVAALLLFFWFLIGSFYLTKYFCRSNSHQRPYFSWFWLIICCLTITAIFSWFIYQHNKFNPGWVSLIEDIRISVNIDKFQNWKDPQKYGFPYRADGTPVAGNVYERTALAYVGLRIIIDHPIGNGLFRSLHAQMHQSGIEYSQYVYTHSAWIDLGLSFGWLGLLLLPTSLLLCLVVCFKNHMLFYRATVTSLAFSLIILYLVGEYGFQHGIEILLFVCSLLAGLCWFNQKQAFDCKDQNEIMFS